ncbi:MAG: phosphohistidine phosphatase [Dokdonia sp.]|jgi:phosphohistidine phosphatase
MKTLYVVRHAKSSWKFDVIDHERPLNDRGLDNAPRVAAHVAGCMPKPDLVMSSDAMRAKTTAFFFAKAYSIPEKEIILDHTLYDFDGRDLVDVIRSCDDTVNCLMVFGHNNAMTNFVNTYGDKMTDNVPTCGFTAIKFDINHWKDMSQGETIFTSIPKEL